MSARGTRACRLPGWECPTDELPTETRNAAPGRAEMNPAGTAERDRID